MHMVRRWQPNSSAIVCKIPLAALSPGGRAPTQQTGLPPHSLQGGAACCQQRRESNHSVTEGRADAQHCCFPIFLQIWVARRLRNEASRRVCSHAGKHGECECGALSNPSGNPCFLFSLCPSHEDLNESESVFLGLCTTHCLQIVREPKHFHWKKAASGTRFTGFTGFPCGRVCLLFKEIQCLA